VERYRQAVSRLSCAGSVGRADAYGGTAILPLSPDSKVILDGALSGSTFVKADGSFLLFVHTQLTCFQAAWARIQADDAESCKTADATCQLDNMCLVFKTENIAFLV
jgi:hypothetical protein